MHLRLSQIKHPQDANRLTPAEIAARALRLKPADILSARLTRKSVDARDKSDVHFTLTLEVETARPIRPLPRNAELIPSPEPAPAPAPVRPLPQRPVVVGLGPAGLFAALTLARAGDRKSVV